MSVNRHIYAYAVRPSTRYPLPAAPHAPSLWIGLGPIGVGGLALIRMAQSGANIWIGDPAIPSGSDLMLRKYLRTSGLPFGIGWRAFTFPLGAHAVDTLTLLFIVSEKIAQGNPPPRRKAQQCLRVAPLFGV